MVRWRRGEAEVERLERDGKLQYVTGSGADGAPLLAQAATTAATAASLVQTDAHSAFVLAYDAARFACVALLAQQGLRTTIDGGHLAVEDVVRAQFGDAFRPFADLRRRRNELEYPRLPSNTATPDEARDAVEVAQRLIDGAGQLLSQLSFFAQ